MDFEKIKAGIESGDLTVVNKKELNNLITLNKEYREDIQTSINFISHIFSYFFRKDENGKPSINFDKLTPLISEFLRPKIGNIFGKKEEEDLSKHPIYKALNIESIEPVFNKYSQEKSI